MAYINSFKIFNNLSVYTIFLVFKPPWFAKLHIYNFDYYKFEKVNLNQKLKLKWTNKKTRRILVIGVISYTLFPKRL